MRVGINIAQTKYSLDFAKISFIEIQIIQLKECAMTSYFIMRTIILVAYSKVWWCNKRKKTQNNILVVRRHCREIVAKFPQILC